MTSHSKGWQSQYPDFEIVRRASYETLVAWGQNLPPAKNFDQHAIRREIFECMVDAARSEGYAFLDKTETQHNKNL